MGFLDQVSSAREVQVTALLPEFQADCTLKIIGMVQTFLNDEQRDVFTLYNASLYGLRQGNPATSIQIPALYVHKPKCQVIAFQETFDQQQMGLMPRHERLAVYTSHYVIQGDFYMGADAMIADFIHTARVSYIAATNVSFFPLFAAQAGLLQHAQLAYIHKSAVHIHHEL